MNSLYATYVPAINAYLNAQTDSACKTWSNVVKIFFAMNVDVKIASKAALAETFNNANHPNYFRIPAKLLEPYFDDFKFSAKTLTGKGLELDVDFIEDSEGIRLTFDAMSQLIYRDGEAPLIESFKFINKIHKTFGRYELAMMNKSKKPTHWTLIERIDDFTSAMQPHITAKETAFKTMDAQPKVYCIVKGTKKTIKARIAKYKAASDAKFDGDSLVPIYESVLSTLDDEISAVLAYLDEFHAMPYRTSQCGVDDKITATKHNIKLSKSVILIDPTQSEYKPNMLQGHIDLVRSKLKRGETTHTPKKVTRKNPNEPALTDKKKTEPNSVDIDLFVETNGKFIDALHTVTLTPREDTDVSTVDKLPESEFEEKEAHNEDEEEEEEEEEDEEDEEDEEEEEEEEEEEPKPIKTTAKSKKDTKAKAKATPKKDTKTKATSKKDTKATPKKDAKADSKKSSKQSAKPVYITDEDE